MEKNKPNHNGADWGTCTIVGIWKDMATWCKLGDLKEGSDDVGMNFDMATWCKLGGLKTLMNVGVNIDMAAPRWNSRPRNSLGALRLEKQAWL